MGKWWKSIKHSVAWRLLEIAKTGDHHERLKAVHQLSKIDHLKDWDYQHLAQICDARTAISLARYNADIRWFVRTPAHGAIRQPKSLIVEIHNYIEMLKPCKCIQHFYGTAFNKFSILKGYIDDRTAIPYNSTSNLPIKKEEFLFLKQCLEVMIHLTKDPQISETLIKLGFLQTLIEIYKLFHFNIEIRFQLSKLLANLSITNNTLNDFFVTGWVGILAKWSRNPDLRVQVTAAKVLANLDVDDPIRFHYKSRIYPLHPRTRIRKQPEVDIVFVHGLLGI